MHDSSPAPLMFHKFVLYEIFWDLQVGGDLILAANQLTVLPESFWKLQVDHQFYDGGIMES